MTGKNRFALIRGGQKGQSFAKIVVVKELTSTNTSSDKNTFAKKEVPYFSSCPHCNLADLTIDADKFSITSGVVRTIMTKSA